MRCGIALGSNIEDRMAHLRAARAAVEALHDLQKDSQEDEADEGNAGAFLCSPVYETEPVDCEPGTAAYLNAVVEINYRGQPILLLEALQQIEAQLGRPSKRPRNAPRTVDLDILYMGNLAMSNDHLVVPHPRLHLRRFVLEPLVALRPNLLLPGRQETVRQLFGRLPPEPAVRLYAEAW